MSFGLQLNRVLPIVLGAMTISLPAQEAKPSEFKAHRLPLIADANGQFFLCKAKTGDKELKMLVDSGAHVDFSMDKKWADANGVKLEETGKAAGISGKSKAYSTKLPDLDVGGAIKMKNVNVSVLDLPNAIPFPKQEDGTTPKLDGILGCTFLMRSQAVLSYPEQRLYIPATGNKLESYVNEAKAAGYRAIPLMKTPEGAPYVTIKFGEKEYSFIIDTAAGGNLMLPEVGKEVGIKMIQAKSGVSGLGGTKSGMSQGLADDILIGNTVKLPQMDFVVMASPGGDNLPKDAPKFGGILGNNFLKQLRVRLDFGTYNMILPPIGKAPATGGTGSAEQPKPSN